MPRSVVMTDFTRLPSPSYSKLALWKVGKGGGVNVAVPVAVDVGAAVPVAVAVAVAVTVGVFVEVTPATGVGIAAEEALIEKVSTCAVVAKLAPR